MLFPPVWFVFGAGVVKPGADAMVSRSSIDSRLAERTLVFQFRASEFSDGDRDRGQGY